MNLYLKNRIDKMGTKRKKKNKGGKIFLTFLTVCLLISVSALCFWGYNKLIDNGNFLLPQMNYSSEAEHIISEAEHTPDGDTLEKNKTVYSFPQIM